MTKHNNHPVPSGRDLMRNIEQTPYYKTAMIIMAIDGIHDPDLHDLFEAFHKIGKYANKLDKGEYKRGKK